MELDITSISAMVAAAGVLVGVTISIMELKNIVRARQGELFLDLYDHYNDPEFVRRFGDLLFNWSWKDYGDWQKKFGPQANIEAYSSWASVGNYFKGVGVLVQEKMIDVRLVEKLMGEPFLKYWEKCEPIIREFRKDYKLPKAWESAEYLYNETKKREQQLARAK
jgi:hypothetical protein